MKSWQTNGQQCIPIRVLEWVLFAVRFRSFGDDLTDAIPFIDGENTSLAIEDFREERGELKREERKPALQTASVAVREGKRASCHLPRTCGDGDVGTPNSAFKSVSSFTFVVDISPLSSKNMSVMRNGEALRDNKQVGETSFSRISNLLELLFYTEFLLECARKSQTNEFHQRQAFFPL